MYFYLIFFTIISIIWILLMSKIINKIRENQILHNTKSYRFLFVIKERSVYGTKTKAYGLYNSCKFVCNKLNKHGIESDVVQVIDNNCIDKYVTQYKPTHCFIEALWVVPAKFETLAKLHPNVKWIVRLHSMIPFLSSEGMAFEWLNEYMELRKKGIKISISCNNEKLYEDLMTIYKSVYPLLQIYTSQKYHHLKKNQTKKTIYWI